MAANDNNDAGKANFLDTNETLGVWCPRGLRCGGMTMETIDRRTAITLGAALFAPTALLPSPAKAEMYARHAGLVIMPGVRRIDLGRWAAALPNYKAIAITDYIMAPGSGFPPEKIRQDTIYHVLEGELRVKKGKEFFVKAGEIFVCAAGQSKEDTNPGEVDAVVRVITLCTS